MGLPARLRRRICIRRTSPICRAAVPTVGLEGRRKTVRARRGGRHGEAQAETGAFLAKMEVLEPRPLPRLRRGAATEREERDTTSLSVTAFQVTRETA